MKMINALGRVLILAVSLAASASHADILFTTTDSLSAADPAQMGRLSRSNIQQDWAGSEPFPGAINPTASYHYVTYAINIGLAHFIQIDIDSASLNTFVSAYQTSYNPAMGLGTNWLGDAGSSGNYSFGPPGVDPRFFDVNALANSVLIIVVNETTPGAGLAAPFHLIVEGYLDADFTSTVPEPSTLLLCFLPLVALLGREAWKRRRDVGGGLQAIGSA